MGAGSVTSDDEHISVTSGDVTMTSGDVTMTSGDVTMTSADVTSVEQSLFGKETLLAKQYIKQGHVICGCCCDVSSSSACCVYRIITIGAECYGYSRSTD
jgi:hypothetical protein